MAGGKIETYDEAARVIALYLNEFCDPNRTYLDMIADAAREAAEEIDELRTKLRNIKKALDLP